MSPYRTPARPEEDPPESDHRCPDGDLLPILVVFWLASVARVVLGIVDDALGVEGTSPSSQFSASPTSFDTR